MMMMMMMMMMIMMMIRFALIKTVIQVHFWLAGKGREGEGKVNTDTNR